MTKIRLLPKEDCLRIVKRLAKLDPIFLGMKDEEELLCYLPQELFGQEFTVNKQVIEYGYTYYYIDSMNWVVPQRFVDYVHSDCLLDIQ